MPSSAPLARRAADALPALLAVAVALAVWPGGPTPFSSAKLAVLWTGTLLAVLSGALWPRHASPAARALGWAWAISLAAAALLGPLTLPTRLALEAGAALLLVALLQRTPSARTLLTGLCIAGTAVAAVALLQALGADPFRPVGLAPDLQTPRLRVYATLGNPDFVAALLGATLVATLARARTASAWAAAALQLAALATCQSFASVLALGAAGLAALVHTALHGSAARRAPLAHPGLSEHVGTVSAQPLTPTLSQGERKAGFASRVNQTLLRRPGGTLLAGGVLGLVCLGALGMGLRGRAGTDVAGGRRYLWRVAAPHVAEAPLLGRGPGSVTPRWPAWEEAYWEGRPAHAAEHRYAGAQDHVHADALEWLLDLGVLGLLPRLALAALALWTALRRPGRTGLALAATLASLLARSAVDFPLARHAEVTLWVLTCAAAFSPRRTP